MVGSFWGSWGRVRRPCVGGEKQGRGSLWAGGKALSLEVGLGLGPLDPWSEVSLGGL